MKQTSVKERLDIESFLKSSEGSLAKSLCLPSDDDDSSESERELDVFSASKDNLYQNLFN
jgi:hypothetical protein